MLADGDDDSDDGDGDDDVVYFIVFVSYYLLDSVLFLCIFFPFLFCLFILYLFFKEICGDGVL